jgi:hypothetical protein
VDRQSVALVKAAEDVLGAALDSTDGLAGEAGGEFFRRGCADDAWGSQPDGFDAATHQGGAETSDDGFDFR